MSEERPTCIKHYSEISDPDTLHYPGSKELLSIGSPFAKALGLTRIGIHHEYLPPGRRTSWPHAESDEEEFVFVIEGHPDVWLNGRLYRLSPGDGVGFPVGTGLAHAFLNNTESAVRLLVVGEADKHTNRVIYPVNPERQQHVGDRWWSDAPRCDLGPHDGIPNAQKKS